MVLNEVQGWLYTRVRDLWIQTILSVESFKLVPRPLNEDPKPKSGKLRLNVHHTCFGRKINWFRPKNSPKWRAPDLEEPRIWLGTKVQSNSRILFASHQSKLVPRVLDPGPWSKVGLKVDTRMTFLLSMEVTWFSCHTRITMSSIGLLPPTQDHWPLAAPFFKDSGIWPW
jgi:hypothetical protein